MAIDNPYDLIDQQYQKEAGGIVTALTRMLESANDLGAPIPHGRRRGVGVHELQDDKCTP